MKRKEKDYDIDFVVLSVEAPKKEKYDNEIY